ncbi:hypothetical protein BDY21DRAFT_157196 [Lineolata rhizophorae]|uniref:Uncharacterized protein n=1 Tax=Lineolata rhizophorae TaxID=578093 RepID=A0A6A6NLD0_9PEZI|nr:hypothetical protein BDY21DRAFT_157196 [Lineolata rhizophorae]
MYNVRFVKPTATEEEVYEACRKAKIDDGIVDREDSYESDASTRSPAGKSNASYGRVSFSRIPKSSCWTRRRLPSTQIM